MGKRLKGTKEFITEIFAAHPGWNARQVHERYKILIGDGNSGVTLNSVQKILQPLRPEMNEISAKHMDEEWHINDVDENQIDAQSICKVLRIKQWKENDSNAPTAVLTKRQAKWISRLHAIDFLYSEVELNRVTFVCALLERYSELTGDIDSYTSDIEYFLTAVDKKEYNERFSQVLEDRAEIFIEYIMFLKSV